MSKQEFLEGLRQSLNGAGAYALVDENLRFYSDYIDAEISKGRSEESVMGELGDPRLIANSICQANGFRDIFEEGKVYTARDTWDGDPSTFAQGREYTGGGFAQDLFGGQDGAPQDRAGSREDAAGQGGQAHGSRPDLRLFRFTGARAILFLVAVLAVVFLFLYAVFAVIGGIFKILSPVLPVVIGVLVIVWLVRKMMGGNQ